MNWFPLQKEFLLKPETNKQKRSFVVPYSWFPVSVMLEPSKLLVLVFGLDSFAYLTGIIWLCLNRLARDKMNSSNSGCLNKEIEKVADSFFPLLVSSPALHILVLGG